MTFSFAQLRCCLPVLLALISAGFASASSESPQTKDAREISFANEIRPIFNKHCVQCHGGVKRAKNLSFIVRERVVATNPADSKKPILPGKPKSSELIRRVTSTDLSERMPPPEHGPALEADEIEKLRLWIAQGAKWEEHWAFVPPIAPAVPKVTREWGQSDVDKFVLAKMEKAGLSPSPPASRRAWLRRVSFDLIGLPPALEDLRTFEEDKGPTAYETVVERLLASPRFGERWASVWLDLARYADSVGFEKDPHRRIWPWRDWVIRALNNNLPFDEFTIRQLAGDLLPEPTLDDRLATAFHRNTQMNTEGGTDDEEFRIAAVVDRINTTFEAWQGLTFRCAQCHAHPYEPIEQNEYYQAKAYFNNTRDWDLGAEYPLLNVPLQLSNFAPANELDRAISDLRRKDFAISSKLAENREQWIRLMPTGAFSNHGTRLAIDNEGEIRTEGTVAHFSRFTLEVPIDTTNLIEAIRLEALPLDPTKARLTPEIGFTISRFRAAIGNPMDTNAIAEAQKKESSKLAEEILFAHAFGDEAEPFRDSDTAVQSDSAGWGPWPRIDRPRSIVFVPAKPFNVPPGSSLRIIIHHDEGPGEGAAWVMNRFKLSFSTNAAWSTLLADSSFQERRADLMNLRCTRATIKSTAVPVVQENETQLDRVTSVFVRGNWMDKSDEVRRGTPQIYGNSTPPADRLGFAKWLVSADNPLTARVVVNRFWEQLFGKGLVETLEDFGSSGHAPSHPDLLDYLAIRLRDDFKWDTKKLLRELVLSATYRQDASISTEQLKKDPRNLLLARGARIRLSAEMVRDQALAAAGLLSTKMYGPPVMPPQPDGIWRAAYSDEKWITSNGEDRYRRAVYTYVRRTAGYPSFQTFDSPSRDICTARRLRTNTPLQALVTLNDPVYVEASISLARKMQAEAKGDLADQIRYGFELATSQLPDNRDVDDLIQLHGKALAIYKSRQPTECLVTGSPNLSALAVVANTLLNLDQALTR